MCRLYVINRVVVFRRGLLWAFIRAGYAPAVPEICSLGAYAKMFLLASVTLGKHCTLESSLLGRQTFF